MALPETLYTYIIGIFGILNIFLTSLALYWSCKIFKKPVSYVQALIPGTILGVIMLIFSGITLLLRNEMIDSNFTTIILLFVFAGVQFLISIALYLFLPKYFFKLEWKQALFIGLVWFGFDKAIGLLLSLLLLVFGLAFVAFAFMNIF